MSTANSYIAELREVTKRFEEKTVLDHVSLKVRSQERLVILGQSGSGKSTILRLILGILMPDEGSVFSSNLKSRVCHGASCSGFGVTSAWFISTRPCSVHALSAIMSLFLSKNCPTNRAKRLTKLSMKNSSWWE